MANAWRQRRVGKVSWAVFAAFSVGTLVALWGVYETSHSPLLQWLVLIASFLLWGMLAGRARKTRPLPPTPQPEPPTKRWVAVPVLIADLALMVGLAWASEGLLARNQSGLRPGSGPDRGLPVSSHLPLDGVMNGGFTELLEPERHGYLRMLISGRAATSR
jgi:hypothetical protein